MKKFNNIGMFNQRSSKIFKVENQDANDSMEAIELITEIKRQKTISYKKNNQEMIGRCLKILTKENKNIKSVNAPTNIKKRKFANRLFPIVGKNTVDEKNLAKSMRMLQNNKKSQKSLVDLNGSSFVDFGTIKENKSIKNSISPYEDLVKSIRRETINALKTKYIVFILHGLEGNPFDMRHIRAAILDNIPDASIYIINNNFKLTNQDINIQAKRLALEVKEILSFLDFFGKFIIKTF
jgi:hypothetical protein